MVNCFRMVTKKLSVMLLVLTLSAVARADETKTVAIAAEIPELFKFDNLYEISLGICIVLLFVTLWWLTILRRKVKEQALNIGQQFERESALQKRYQELFENASDMVLTIDQSGFITALNLTGEEVLGCTRDRARTLKLSAFLAETQVQAFESWTAHCAADKTKSFEAAIVGAHRRRSVLEFLARPSTGAIGSVEIIARDITARRAAEEALRHSEERFSSAFRASPVAIAISALPDGRLIDVNQSFIKLFGFEYAEVIGHTADDLDLWCNLEDKLRLEKSIAENGSIGGVEVRFRVKSGEFRTTLVFMERVVTGGVPCLLWLSHDMTDRQNLEAQVQHLLKMEAVGRLAAGVAHDFNNILTVIQGNTDWVMKKYEHEENMLTSLRRIHEATGRAAHLTRQLLTFSRKESIVLASLDLNLAVTTATKMFKHLLRADIILKIRFAANLPLVQADAPMLEQVLMNLVVNARDAMNHGGELTLSSHAVTIDAAYVKSHPEAAPGEFVCLEVSDTGCGMDAATQARIFEPFFTTKEPGKGTGLGLATCYGIVNQHKGWIEVQSKKGFGTTFKIYLPAQPAEFPAPTHRRRDVDRRSILILEDEPEVLELTSRFLADQGHRILKATTGIEAMQVWSENPGDVQLLLTDVRIPLGMSGFDVAENLLALNPALKVIFISGYFGDSAPQEKAFRNTSVFLSKPCAPEVLGAAITDALSKKN